jgi:hypothetical protein
MMRKNGVVLGFLFVILLGACSQIPGFTPTPGTGPTADLFNTAVAQTLTARPTLVVAAVTDAATLPPASPSPTPVLAVSDTPSATLAPTTPVTDLTTTPITATSIPATATLAPVNVAATPTLVPSQVTAIWTLAVRKYGTLPPAVPFSQVTLINKAKTEAYISLQVTMPDGQYSIIEYPVEGSVKIQAPVGSYLYVAWVGGNKMIGNFRLHHNDDLSITLYKDKVVIK